MVRYRVVSLAAVLAIAAAAGAGCSSSSKTSSTSSSTAAGGGLTVTTGAAAGTTVDVTAGDTKGTDGPMTLVPSVSTVKAGDVTFTLKNAGTIEHELIVLKTSLSFDKIPVVDCNDPPVPCATGADKIDEGPSVGESGDPNPKPGESKTFTIKGLAPGSYVLVCNIAKHYQLGMRAAFTVS